MTDQNPQQPAQPQPPVPPVPPPAQPGYPPQAPPAPAAVDPGRGLAIGGLICGIILGPLAFIGLILSIVALNKSKAAGMSNGLAVAGIVVSSLFFIAAVVTIGLVIAGAAAAAVAMCTELGPGVHQIGTGTIDCPTVR